MRRIPLLSSHHLVFAAVAALPAALAPAQTLAIRDGVLQSEGMVAYDASRSRLVQVGHQGETREFDGSDWLLRPGPGPQMLGRLVARDPAREVLAFGRGYGGTAETWTYGGVRWQRLTPATSPSLRTGFAMAYDSWRDRVVVFGGIGVLNAQCDTWEWDGTTWAQRATTGPGACVRTAMAFDRARGVCVLFGGEGVGIGTQDQTWEWNGLSWQQRSPINVPAARSDHAMIYDEARSRIVMTGGYVPQLFGTTSEVWQYDGTTWTQALVAGGPGPIYKHDLVYARDRSEALLVGGLATAVRSRDVWRRSAAGWQLLTSTPFVPNAIQPGNVVAEPLQGGVLVSGGIFGHFDVLFAGSTWTQLQSSTSPPGRQGAASWTDGSNAWMFGGSASLTQTFFNDLWQWTTNGWQPHVLVPRPSQRSYARAAWDSTRGEAVLFGGRLTIALGDTWTFNGTAWTQESPATSPPPRSSHGIAYDPLRDRVVMFGGAGPFGPLGDTWEWNGTNWSQITVAAPPPAYGSASLVFDPRTSRITMATAPVSQSLIGTPVEIRSYDGVAWTTVPLDETRVVGRYYWLMNDPGGNRLLLVDGETVHELVYQPAAVAAFGSPCGAAPRLAGRTRPRLGESAFGIDLVGAPPSSFVALGASLTPATLPLANCTLLLGTPQHAVLVPTNAQGFATLVIPVPPTPALTGTTILFQAAALATTGLVMTEGLRIVVGP